MALTTVAGVSAAILLLRSDVKSSAAIFRRNVRQIRNWIEEESLSSSSMAGEKVKPKQVEGQVHERKLPRTISTKNLMSCLREEHGSLEALFVICPV